jgi:hypothetical protein
VVAETVATLRGVPLPSLAAQCAANTVRLFGNRLRAAPEERQAPQEG